MYYLWKDKSSAKDQVLVYITDYKEIRPDGKVKIDGRGYLDVDLVCTHERKSELLIFAQKMMEG